MHPAKPIGNNLYAPLFVRVPLGAYFILAGLAKLKAPLAFVDEIRKFNILPGTTADLFGILLPYFEIISGGLLIIGLWTTAGALLASLLLGSFVYALGVKPDKMPLFNKDIILLGAAISLLYTGGGAFSIDNFKNGGSSSA